MRFVPFSILVGSLPMLAGCGSVPAGQTKQRPAIDVAAPTKIETATFALG